MSGRYGAQPCLLAGRAGEVVLAGQSGICSKHAKGCRRVGAGVCHACSRVCWAGAWVRCRTSRTAGEHSCASSGEPGAPGVGRAGTAVPVVRQGPPVSGCWRNVAGRRRSAAGRGCSTFSAPATAGEHFKVGQQAAAAAEALPRVRAWAGVQRRLQHVDCRRAAQLPDARPSRTARVL